MNEQRRVAFPRMAEYNQAMRYAAEVAVGVKYVMPPKMTKRTLELGMRYSPDTVCTPFKTTLGSMIEALEAGADTLIMVMGYCRLGYYGELQEQILRDLGYHFDMINLSEYDTTKKKNYLKILKRLNPKLNYARLTKGVLEVLKMVEYTDLVIDEYYQNCGFEDHPGDYKRAFERFQRAMDTAKCREDIEAGYQEVKHEFASIPKHKPFKPLRVGIIGEYFSVQDPHSNLGLEQKLADMGVEVHRWMNLTHRNIHYSGEKNLHVRIQDLCTYEMGPTSTANIWCARDYAQRGFNGIIHVKSAGCTPEIDIVPVLQNISAESKVPILYLTYDTQTSDTGLLTRLEAFYDMIAMREAENIL